MTDPDLTDPYDAFNRIFGSALMNWSFVEHRLLWWFCHLSGMPEPMARAVYFSARSFKSRSEMLQSVLRCGFYPKAIARRRTHKDGLRFLSSALNKADSYCGFRNSLAHGVGYRDISDSREFVNFVHGAVETPIDINRIEAAARNFDKLALLIAQGYYYVSRTPYNLELLQGHHEQLLLLPNQPDCETPSRNQLGRLRQRESERRKASKKARGQQSGS